ncbi:putative ABC transporter substrate-binding protein [Arthrobacter globiformis NBRC 12137]|uniref:Putative ABC transporter substrate-binding protein n=1 Tax=Arthrobacter globiformis (strain ATCC 8010 / DSM 20124 / JCM 1332 / NBRC 12137 / NCIMB 8907 / NRRL B-2979 / 168) TaxID=1077972 RepID=H0QSQ7_ARTG1|nr:ABC transporter substrate-binding protein [Arthrobacter globiformis]GAB15858.1 putative ABC transporter substrate-binding protein [Arthrobacter globiformis NBRC 12137]
MTSPNDFPGSTRIAAGQPAGRKRPSGLKIGIAAGILAVLGAGVAVATTAANNAAPESANAAAATSPATELKLGYFGNITHATALVGVQKGFIAKELGGTKLSTQVFNAGPAAIEALNAGAIDATYIGPNPAINSFVKSKGESISIIAGAASGGAQLVVKPEIKTAADLKGKTLASPQLGGTQDVALRAWLGKQGYKTNTDGGGEVAINPTENAQTLKLFQNGKLDGAWLPEPWASRLVLQAGAKVLVDEKDLWDGSLTGKPGEFPTTILIVNKKFAAEHPQTVEALLKGHVEAVKWLNDTPAAEKATEVNAALKEAAGKALPQEVIDRSLKNIVFTVDPLAGAFKKLLQDGVDAGTTKQADINGIFDLAKLNEVTGEKTSAAGLGKE